MAAGARRRAKFRASETGAGLRAPVSSRDKWLAAAAAAAVAAVLLGNGGFRTLVKNALLLRRIGAELKEETRARAELENRIRAVTSDDREIEKAARRELGYLKPGEIEYRFPPPGKR